MNTEKKKMGRPTDNPKILSTRVRFSKEDIDRLDYITKITNKTKAEVIRSGIEKIYNDLKKEDPGK